MRWERRSPPIEQGEIPPVALKRATQRTALAMLTPKRLAAALRDMPLPPPPHNAFAKIVGKRHPRRPPSAATILKQIKADPGIPPRFNALGDRSSVCMRVTGIQT